MNEIDTLICEKFNIQQRNLPLVWEWGDRCTLAKLFAELGFTKGAEVGVCQGVYAEILCRFNPDLELLCIDPWQPSTFNTPRKVRRLEKETRQRLAGMNVQIIKDYSLEVAQTIPDGSLDFVYIDALHEFNHVMLDIIHWIPKVRPRGIIAGHDFCHFQDGGVVYAVEAYTRAHHIDPWYVTRCDKAPSWLWVVS